MWSSRISRRRVASDMCGALMKLAAQLDINGGFWWGMPWSFFFSSFNGTKKQKALFKKKYLQYFLFSERPLQVRGKPLPEEWPMLQKVWTRWCTQALKHSNTSDLYLIPESAQSRFAIYSTRRHKNTFPFTKILIRRGRKFKNGTARLKMCPHCARSYSASYLATHRAPES